MKETKYAWSKRFRNSLFPQAIELDKKQGELLKLLYPSISWEYVRFYRGLPWFMRLSFAYATALPSGYRPGFVNVYLKDDEEEDDFRLTATLVHESFHILQYQDSKSMGKKHNLSFYRPFMLNYLAYFFDGFLEKWAWGKKNSLGNANYEAYRYHPMEIPAYDFEAYFCEYYWDYWDAKTAEEFVQKFPQLIRKNSTYTDLKPASRSVQTLSFVLVSGIVIVKPIIEFIILLMVIFSRPFG